MKNKLEEIDFILARYEDWMHGYNGQQCTKARKLLREVLTEVNKISQTPLLADSIISDDNIIPEWWHQYKKANPDDKDEYNKQKHCCPRFWKDFCDCVK